jgi:uncharacterized membrane protein
MRRATSVSELTRRNVEAISKMERVSEEQRTWGERAADRFAAVVGSWPFIIIQSVLLLAWVVLNLVAWSLQWDPYPFILLNLVFSTQAAYAAPLILLSQNRQADIDRITAEHDYQVNQTALQYLKVLHSHAHGQTCRCVDPVVGEAEPDGTIRVPALAHGPAANVS